MSMGGSTKSVKSVEKPWGPSEPYLKDIMGQAQSLYRSGIGEEYYPFSTHVPLSNQTGAALDMIEQRAVDGSPLIDQAVAQTQSMMAGGFDGSPVQTYLSPTAQGAHLNGNPWLDQTFDYAADKVSDRVNRSAGLKGRTGSGAHQQLLQSQLGNLATDIYGQNYQRERDRQLDATNQLQSAYESDFARRMGAITAAQSLAQVPYHDAAALQQVGARHEQGAQGQLTDFMNRYDFEQQAPWNNLGRYNAILGGMGSLGGSSRQTTRGASVSMNPLSLLSGLFGGF